MAIATVESRAIHISDKLNDLYFCAVKVPGFIELPVILSQIFDISPLSVVQLDQLKAYGIKVPKVTDETYHLGGLYALLTHTRHSHLDVPDILARVLRDSAQEAADPTFVSEFNEVIDELLGYQIPIAQSPELGNLTLRELFQKVKYACYYPMTAGAYYGSTYLSKGDIGMALEVTAAGSLMTIVLCGTHSFASRVLDWSKIANTAAAPLPTPRKSDGAAEAEDERRSNP